MEPRLLVLLCLKVGVGLGDAGAHALKSDQRKTKQTALRSVRMTHEHWRVWLKPPV